MMEHKEEAKNEIDDYLGLKDTSGCADKNQTIRPFTEHSRSSEDLDDECNKSEVAFASNQLKRTVTTRDIVKG